MNNQTTAFPEINERTLTNNHVCEFYVNELPTTKRFNSLRNYQKKKPHHRLAIKFRCRPNKKYANFIQKKWTAGLCEYDDNDNPRCLITNPDKEYMFEQPLEFLLNLVTDLLE